MLIKAGFLIKRNLEEKRVNKTVLVASLTQRHGFHASLHISIGVCVCVCVCVIWIGAMQD